MRERNDKTKSRRVEKIIRSLWQVVQKKYEWNWHPEKKKTEEMLADLALFIRTGYYGYTPSQDLKPRSKKQERAPTGSTQSISQNSIQKASSSGKSANDNSENDGEDDFTDYIWYRALSFWLWVCFYHHG